MNKKNIVIFISGNGSNMERIISESKCGVLKDVCNILFVISNNKDSLGLKKAELLDIKTFIANSEDEIIDILKNYNVDYLILAGFMKILSPFFVNLYKNKIINIHPADTNEYKGKNGYKWAFENNKKTTKITVHYVDKGIDTGKIIKQQEIDISNCTTLDELIYFGLTQEHDFYSNVLSEIFQQN